MCVRHFYPTARAELLKTEVIMSTPQKDEVVRLEGLTEVEVHRLNHYSREAYVDIKLYGAFQDYAEGKITKAAYTKVVNRWAPLLKTYREHNIRSKVVPIFWDRWKDASEVLDADAVEKELELWR